MSVALSIIVLAGGSLLALTQGAEAHERRQVQSYTFVVGWLAEPAILNQPNAIDLRVTKTDGGTPVTGLQETVKAQVTAEGKSVDVPLRARFNTPGAYDGRMIPTALGSYSFKFTGTVEGATINETFTAGQGTFGLIEEGNQFPNPIPSNQQMDETLRGFEERIVNLESSGAGGGNPDTAMAVGIAGVVFGLIGLGVGGMALARSKS
jgi:hypothetical protein